MIKTHPKFRVAESFQPHEVRLILNLLGIKWNPNKVSSSGWTLISSPLRIDKHPSFGLNIRKGWFKDHARPDIKGDIITLIQYVKGSNRREAERWALSILNLNQN